MWILDHLPLCGGGGRVPPLSDNLSQLLRKITTSQTKDGVRHSVTVIAGDCLQCAVRLRHEFSVVLSKTKKNTICAKSRPAGTQHKVGRYQAPVHSSARMHGSVPTRRRVLVTTRPLHPRVQTKQIIDKGLDPASVDIDDQNRSALWNAPSATGTSGCP